MAAKPRVAQASLLGTFWLQKITDNGRIRIQMADDAERGATKSQGRLSDFVDRLQGSGRYSFTGKEIRKVLAGTFAARQAAVRRLKKKGRIVSPRRSFFVTVPVEYRSAGSPPASWFIDNLMRYMGQPYYVGLLTAAAIHGAAHQQPQSFQVVTDRPTRPVALERVRIEFHRNRMTGEVPIAHIKTETGTMQVSEVPFPFSIRVISSSELRVVPRESGG